MPDEASTRKRRRSKEAHPSGDDQTSSPSREVVFGTIFGRGTTLRTENDWAEISYDDDGYLSFKSSGKKHDVPWSDDAPEGTDFSIRDLAKHSVEYYTVGPEEIVNITLLSSASRAAESSAVTFIREYDPMTETAAETSARLQASMGQR
jgi:hypothetical protein